MIFPIPLFSKNLSLSNSWFYSKRDLYSNELLHVSIIKDVLKNRLFVRLIRGFPENFLTHILN